MKVLRCTLAGRYLDESFEKGQLVNVDEERAATLLAFEWQVSAKVLHPFEVADETAPPEPVGETPPVAGTAEQPLDGMPLEELRALAKARGLTYKGKSAAELVAELQT